MLESSGKENTDPKYVCALGGKSRGCLLKAGEVRCLGAFVRLADELGGGTGGSQPWRVPALAGPSPG